MDLTELEERLPAFCDAHIEGASQLTRVWKMPGHAGFSYGFTVETEQGEESWFLRLPPPGVKLVGTADVLRQVAVLTALDGTDVPHCSVRWHGSDPRWFGRPYFVVPVLEGDVVRLEEDGWTRGLDSEERRDMARQAIGALAGLHEVPPEHARVDDEPYLGDPVSLDEDVTRWDRFAEKAAEPERLALVPEVRSALLEKLPEESPVGTFHGDFQWGNLFFGTEGAERARLKALIDFELTGVGAVLNDVGWIATFADPQAWGPNREIGDWMPGADELVAMYRDAAGGDLPDLAWFRALAAYKFAIISGFNLMLHRRGKRHDPLWEDGRHSIEPLLTRARDLLA